MLLPAPFGPRIAVELPHGMSTVTSFSARVRPYVRQLVERALPALAVIAPGEIAPTVRVQSMGVVTLDEN